MLVGVGALGAWLVAQVGATGAEGTARVPVYETVVVAPRIPAHEGSFSLDGREALPGAAGDPGRALENAPGVGRLAPGTSGLVLWGAAPQESRVLFDGVEIPALFHFGGWRSVVLPEVVRGVSVVPGAIPADRGRALGGIVEIESATPSSESRRAWIAANPIDASLGAEGPVGERVSVLAAGRIGYLDRLAGLLRTRENQALMPLPGFRDLFAKAVIDIGAGRSLTVQAVHAQDTRHLALDVQSPTTALVEDHTRSFTRAILRYTEAGDNDTTRALLFVGSDRARLDRQVGLVPVSQDASELSAGVRLSHSVLVGRQFLEMGVEGVVASASQARTGSLTNPAREGDKTVFGASPGGAIGSDRWYPILGNIAPYALAELRWGRLELRPGLRMDGILVSSDRVLPPSGLTPRAGFSRTTWSAEPRLAVSLAAKPWLAWAVSGGIRHQHPDPADLSPVFGSPSLRPSRAMDGVFSVRGHGGSIFIEAAAFARRLDDLPVRNPSPNPALAQALLPSGRGRAYGAQLSLRRECGEASVCALVAYTLARSQRRGPGDEGWRLLDFDQTHVLSAVLGYRGRRWSGSLRLRYASGMPRTPVVGAFFDSQAGIYRPVLGDQNSIRLPAFAELDLRVERSWQWRRARLALCLEVVNATNRSNAEEIVYSGDYANHAYVAGLPLLALVGFRLEI